MSINNSDHTARYIYLLKNIKYFSASIELESFTLGSKTPYIKHLRVYETSEAGPGGGRRAMSWSSITTPPSGLRQASRFQIVLETTVGLQSDEFLMILRTKLGGKWSVYLFKAKGKREGSLMIYSIGRKCISNGINRKIWHKFGNLFQCIYKFLYSPNIYITGS